MNGKAAVVLLSGVLFACAPVPAPAPAPAPPPPAAPVPEAAVAHHVVAIRGVQCDALLKLAEDDRASASMFYIGYTASRRHQARIDVAELSGLEAAALGYCAAHPGWPAATAFDKSFADNGR
ncbi:MAG TPA: hypothetical protein VG651_14230 [Stellaceae bacterium]|nr:hypothetical protein [Stellaceae bacterium]